MYRNLNRADARKGSHEPLGRPCAGVRFLPTLWGFGVFAVAVVSASTPAQAQWWLCQHVGVLTLCSSSDGSALLTCQRVGRQAICNTTRARGPRRKSGGR